MDIRTLAATVEADRRGILPQEKRDALNELRARARRNDQSLAMFVEPMLTMATGAIAEPVSGFVGLAGLPFGVDVAANAVKRTQEAMTYQPRTEAGQQGLQNVGETIAPIAEPLGKARDFIADKTADTLGPEAGTAVYTALTAAPDLLGLKGARVAGKAGKLGKQYELGDIGSQGVNRQRGAITPVMEKTLKDSGFDTSKPLYRGTMSDESDVRPYTHFSKNKDVANSFSADPETWAEIGIDVSNIDQNMYSGANVSTNYARLGNIATMSDAKQVMNDIPELKNKPIQATFPELEKRGFNSYDSDYETVVFNPEDVVNEFSDPSEIVRRGGGEARSEAQPFQMAERDMSDIFGDNAKAIRYTDEATGGTIEVLTRPNQFRDASVLELYVPDEFRRQGVAKRLQEKVMKDFPSLMGQVSSKYAARNAYNMGRRPAGKLDATLEETFAIIDDMSSVNMVTPE